MVAVPAAVTVTFVNNVVPSNGSGPSSAIVAACWLVVPCAQSGTQDFTASVPLPRASVPVQTVHTMSVTISPPSPQVRVIDTGTVLGSLPWQSMTWASPDGVSEPDGMVALGNCGAVEPDVVDEASGDERPGEASTAEDVVVLRWVVGADVQPARTTPTVTITARARYFTASR